ncbi:MAG: type II toxin-antitoxin system RelE/ParE family toxin [Alphaproteobacteria bacterium]|nr:type II toxin-antitoxin system RelE/ParE family toxin [Alphaproteobacteria bacterium]
MSSPNNTFELVITDPARNDLDGIAGYTFIQWGGEKAIEYTEQLYQTILSIAENTDIGGYRYGVPDVIKGRKSGRHVVFYRIQEQTIFIMRILHESMDHGRHLQES